MAFVRPDCSTGPHVRSRPIQGHRPPASGRSAADTPSACAGSSIAVSSAVARRGSRDSYTSQSPLKASEAALGWVAARRGGQTAVAPDDAPPLNHLRWAPLAQVQADAKAVRTEVAEVDQPRFGRPLGPIGRANCSVPNFNHHSANRYLELPRFVRYASLYQGRRGKPAAPMPHEACHPRINPNPEERP